MLFLAPRSNPFNTLKMQNIILDIVHHSTFVMALMQRTCLNNEAPLCLFFFCAFWVHKKVQKQKSLQDMHLVA